jgi:D-alanyl-D-alanine carboxypeptidase
MNVGSRVTRHHFKSKIAGICLVLVAVVAVMIGGFWAYTEAEAAQKRQATNEIIRVADARLTEIEAKKKEPVYIALPGIEKLRAPVENYEDPTNIWTLVNKNRALPEGYVPPELVVTALPTRLNSTPNEKRVRQVIDKPLTELFAAAQKEGRALMIGSAYRSAETQLQLFNTYVARVGYEQADRYSAHAGHSEHQTGLAVDISTVSQQCYLSECFIGTADGQWLAANAHKYGFTLRYPKGKESITGYNFEPWHYRYVGIELATALHDSGLTLDEAWPYLEAALATLRSNRAIK